MKQLLLFVCLATLGLSSCSKKISCPAYGTPRASVQSASPAMASHGPAQERQ